MCATTPEPLLLVFLPSVKNTCVLLRGLTAVLLEHCDCPLECSGDNIGGLLLLEICT